MWFHKKQGIPYTKIIKNIVIFIRFQEIQMVLSICFMRKYKSDFRKLIASFVHCSSSHFQTMVFFLFFVINDF